MIRVIYRRRRCRVCGCREANVVGAMESLRPASFWVEDDLCSACAPSLQKDIVEELTNERLDD